MITIILLLISQSNGHIRDLIDNNGKIWENARKRFADIGGPNDWGPALWHSLHCAALNYPLNLSEIDKENYQTLFKNVHQIIPCYSCALHYDQNLQNFDLHQFVDSRSHLFQFTVDMHNLVNEQTNKTSMRIDDALKLYQNSCAAVETPHDLESFVNGLHPNNTQKNALFYIIFSLITVVVAAWTLYRWCRYRKNRRKRSVYQMIDNRLALFYFH